MSSRIPSFPLAYSPAISLYSTTSSIAINAMGGGQSLIDRMDWDAFLAQLPVGSNYYESAVGGNPTTRTVGDQTGDSHWVDDLLAPTYSDGPLLTQYIAEVDLRYGSRTDVNGVIWQQWVTSRNYVRLLLGAGILSKDDYKNAELHLFGRFRELHGADTVITVGLPHRFTGATAQENEGCQLMREAYIEIAEADPLIELVEHCDIDLEDNTHHKVTSGEIEFGNRMGSMLNYGVNGGVKDIYPIATSASIKYSQVTIWLDNDITAPSSGVGQCAVAQNYVEKTGITLTRVSDSVALFTLDDNEGVRIDDSPVMRIGSGCNAGLATIDADTLNNADGTLPARGAVVTLTDGNPITSIDAVKVYIDAKYSTKTFGTGLEVTKIEGLKGAGFETHPNAINTNPTYDATAFSGRGGLKGVANSCMQNIDAFIAGEVKVIFGTIETPAVLTNVRLLHFALNDGAANTNASFFASGSDFKYGRDEASGFPVLFAGAVGAPHVFMLKYNDAGSCDLYLDSSYPLGNFDPSDAYNIYDTLQLFARAGNSDGVVDLLYGALGIADEALLEKDTFNIMHELGAEFSKTIAYSGFTSDFTDDFQK